MVGRGKEEEKDDEEEGEEPPNRFAVIAATSRMIAATGAFEAVLNAMLSHASSGQQNRFQRTKLLFKDKTHPVTKEIEAALEETSLSNKVIVDFCGYVVRTRERHDIVLLGNLSLAILNAYGVLPPTLPSFPKAAVFAGALIEYLHNPEILATQAHCRALFAGTLRYLEYSQIIETNNDDNDEQDTLREILNQLCPPLMTLFPGKIDLLNKLRKDPSSRTIVGHAGYASKMLREFLLQPFREDFLFALVDIFAEDKNTILFAQKARVTSITDNRRLTEHMRENFDGALAFGDKLEMSSWTAMRANKEGISADFRQSMPHRIWQEGIPNDIPWLDGYRVVFFHSGSISRIWGTSERTFGLIEEVFDVETPPLSEEECRQWTGRIQNTSDKEYIDALYHQLGTGGDNAGLHRLIEQASQHTF